MSTSVGIKVRKKQSSLSAKTAEAVPVSADVHLLETSLLSLENACMRVLESDYTETSDTERMYWQQRLMNIAKPVSLALAECNGLRRFHYHYRHRADDETILHPVLEPSPVSTLAQVCEVALKSCRSDLVGIQDTSLLKARTMLEGALQGFLVKYRDK
jgi:hypothetical protein